MKFDPIIVGMVKSDVSIVLSDVVKPHLSCECVDRTDLDAWADHLGDVLSDMLETPPDPDGSYAEFAKGIVGR